MSIKVSQAFSRTSANPVDETMALTKAQMLTVNDNLMPAYYFTICQDDGEIYLYNKTATPSASTGKFTKFEGGGGGGGSTEGLVITKTLLASGWNSTTKQQTLTFNDYDEDMGGVIGVPTSATSAQKEEYATAIINIVAQSGNQFTFECEEVPTIDLPVTLYAGGGGGGGSADFPSGGTTGQALVKHSNADNDVEWATIESEQVQYDTMPTASASNVGQVVQFIGTTTATYINGLFYECVNDSGTYKWVQKDVQTYPDADLTNVFSSGFPIGSVTDTRAFQYSTGEQIVGTWIDGKPIYQKTYTGLSVSLSGDWVTILDVSALSPKHLIHVHLYTLDGTGVLTETHPQKTQIDDKKIKAKMDNLTATINIITLQYTKTTD